MKFPLSYEAFVQLQSFHIQFIERETISMWHERVRSQPNSLPQQRNWLLSNPAVLQHRIRENSNYSIACPRSVY